MTKGLSRSRVSTVWPWTEGNGLRLIRQCSFTGTDPIDARLPGLTPSTDPIDEPAGLAARVTAASGMLGGAERRSSGELGFATVCLGS